MTLSKPNLRPRMKNPVWDPDKSSGMVLLGVNIDHVATLRNARGGREPDVIEAALIAESHGADGITVHLREDRRHIRDDDVWELREIIQTRLKLEMAATDEMIRIALQLKPDMVTLVPERREELTTEGGLDVLRFHDTLKVTIARLTEGGLPVSLFVDPVQEQLEACRSVGAPIVEIHTGEYAQAFLRNKAKVALELQKLMTAARDCEALGLKVNAGHGLTYENVESVLAMPGLVELNIGHNIIANAIFQGLGPAVARMKKLLQATPVLSH